jgi:uncharacterized membrane protein YozB (DUF420 family)
MTVRDLPALNAVLNATSAALLAYGYSRIRGGDVTGHRRAMIAALVSSGLFLVSYLYYHFHVGSVRFQGTGAIRTVYFTILLTHTVLAAAIVPLVLVTVTRALRGRLEAHRRVARWTLPLWGYVSVTGVVIYWMLYRL